VMRGRLGACRPHGAGMASAMPHGAPTRSDTPFGALIARAAPTPRPRATIGCGVAPSVHENPLAWRLKFTDDHEFYRRPQRRQAIEEMT
jgi:hypothetical protein